MCQPSVPNPQQVANAQTTSNVATATANARLNNVNTFGPLGSTVFKEMRDDNGKLLTQAIKSGTGTIQVPRYQQFNTLSDPQQRLLDLQESAGINLGKTAVKESDFLNDYLGKQFNPGTLPDAVNSAPNAPTLKNANGIDTPDLQMSVPGSQDYGAQRDQVVNAIMSRLNPQIQQGQTALDQKLANQGISMDSEAWRRAQTQQGQNENDLRMQAVLAGGQEQSRMAGLDLAAAQFGNQSQEQNYQNQMSQLGYNNQTLGQNYDLQNQEAQFQQTLRQQQYQEAMAQRQEPLSEVNQLMNGAQPTIPQFQSFTPSTIQPTPVGQYIYQSAAMQNQANSAAMGGMFGLGSSLLTGLFGLSDRRAKENIKKVGKLDNDLPIFAYNYKGDTKPQIGLIAQDVEKVHPGAVATHPSGLKMVHYGKAVQPVRH